MANIFVFRNCAVMAAGVANRWNNVPNLVRVPCATGEDFVASTNLLPWLQTPGYGRPM